jgi:hypothetical protein
MSNKERYPHSPNPALAHRDLVSSSLGIGWWSLSGSNRRPDACKATALPAELRPHAPVARRDSHAIAHDHQHGRPAQQVRRRGLRPRRWWRSQRSNLVGRVGVEPTTSRLSGVRSNHLSYRPVPAAPSVAAKPRLMAQLSRAGRACPRAT